MFGQVCDSGVGGVRLIVPRVCMKRPCAVLTAAVLPAPILRPLIDPAIQTSHHSVVFHRAELDIGGCSEYIDFAPRLDLCKAATRG
jgi:hypothetical protein